MDTTILQLVEKFGLAAVVVLLIIFYIMPCLRAIKDELHALTIILAKQNGFSVDDIEKAREQTKISRKKGKS